MTPNALKRLARPVLPRPAAREVARMRFLARRRRWAGRPSFDAPALCECQRTKAQCQCAQLFGGRR